MKKVRNWLMILMCVSLAMAVTFDWTVLCKVEVAVNAIAILTCIVWDIIRRK